ncbi:Tetratricopeptide TPR_2 repeat protein [Candidatus Magnetobacterium bavaricum]|uniref:Tetratricopeptide TPR_2 repeat protein n=1 Tax=Candidatus Magnetobacterium bavaricum TaxID=29290 RepID=A0A0F3GS71_9BACT|nr:Tetratricopeptide TPR_2 repeat protein [Candidatus Magnetobacterium bavaricum]
MRIQIIKDRQRLHLCIIAILVISTLSVYHSVRDNGFVSYDDYKYVTENRDVAGGISAKSVRWAFTTTYFSNWHPLTWLSHLLDVQLYGMHPRGHHVTSVIIHVINVLLLYLFLYRATTMVWQSALVAALFALHPLAVESVAWVSERKNLLVTSFWLAAMLSYLAYVRRPNLWRYVAVMAAFALGIMSKPMIVTFPFTLLLLDYWPLGRLKGDDSKSARAVYVRLVIEKLPFFLLTIASSVITVLAQKEGGAVVSLNSLSLTSRLLNVLTSYAGYIRKTVWPTDLAAFYPYLSHPVWELIASVLVLLTLTVFALWRWRSSPYILMGWCWFLGTLVPVIQVVQVGVAPMADRYMYVPIIGLFIIVAWGGAEMARKWRSLRSFFIAAAVMVSITFAMYTWRQAGSWRDSFTLYEHAINVTRYNYVAHNNYGQALMKAGLLDEAITHFKEGLKVMPLSEEINYNMWLALSRQGKLQEANSYLMKSASMWFAGDKASLYKQVAIDLLNQKNYEEAISYFLLSARDNNKDAELFNELGVALSALKKYDQALVSLSRSISLDGTRWQPYYHKGLILKELGRYDEAEAELTKALALSPGSQQIKTALDNLHNVKDSKGWQR